MCKVMCTVHIFFLPLSVSYSPFALHRAMKLKLPRYSMNILWYIPRGLLSHIQYIHHTCYKVNRKPACFTSSRCCHVREREETEPNRERDSRQPPQRREEQEEKKGASFTHARLQHPPPLPAPLPALPRGVHCYSVRTT